MEQQLSLVLAPSQPTSQQRTTLEFLMACYSDGQTATVQIIGAVDDFNQSDTRSSIIFRMMAHSLQLLMIHGSWIMYRQCWCY